MIACNNTYSIQDLFRMVLCDEHGNDYFDSCDKQHLEINDLFNLLYTEDGIKVYVTSAWILMNGIWNDNGTWDDESEWID